ncbi:PREDICTED: uncharacterized protein LOC107333935 isoform X3 [Acropora digitifera]|uniref:uncharacterized protein LOC107333935 isoform X3 n=1 Tax=Acropora digitifera TaxID=70779 RepID=UPI00077A732A|nr:PREDICTED: uncharacterized protein LOC107333935 isoform X3 [Acropora digitifera]
MSQDEVNCQQASAVHISQGQILNITLLASEWKSSAGGLSTLNREFAINLSQIKNVKVSLLVPEGVCKEEDKSEARSFGISILDAKKCVGLDSLVWLSNPPQDHKIDIIVGHGVKLGCQVQLIKRQAQFQNCKWVHVVHTAPEDLSKYKAYSNPNSKGEEKHWDEVDLCKSADLVVPVGPKLEKAYHGYLQSSKKSGDFFELIPGLFEREFGDLVAKQNPKDERDDFIVLLCGRGDKEDFEVKGYDIAVKAFADHRLKGKRYSLLFVGSLKGEQDRVRERLLNCGIDKKQLTVREFVKSREKMKDLFCEVDMVIMPSKSEGFGLVALEALSAGLPILVGSNSGFARAIEDIPLGLYSIVDSEDPSKWAERVEGVRDRHRVALKENKMLKEQYRKEYCWKTQCEELVDRLWKMVYGTSAAQAIAAGDLVEQCHSAVLDSVCQPDSTMQQHSEKDAVTLIGRGNEGTSRTSGTSGDGLTLPELAGTSGAQAVAADDLVERCPSAVSESVCQPNPRTMQQHIEKSAVTLTGRGNAEGTLGGDLTLPELADHLIRLKIETLGANEEQQKAFYELLLRHATEYMKSRNNSKLILPGVGAFLKHLDQTYNVSCVTFNLGSLIISLECKTLKGLDKLWNDYLSGHLNKVANKHLVADEMMRNLSLKTINLKTTIDMENYLHCRKILAESSGTSTAQPIVPEDSVCPPDPPTMQQPFKERASTSDNKSPKKLGKRGISEPTDEHGEADKTPSFAQQSVLDEGTSILGMASAAGDKEVPVKQEDTDWMIRKKKAGIKQEDTDWMFRKEKARASRSALHKASGNGQYEEVKKYLSSGCAVDVKDKFSLTPLHLACWYGQESIVKLLLEHGADVSARDRFLLTPLHLACWYGQESIVKLLLEHGADVSARDRLQFTPLYKADRCNHRSTVKLLEDHGAKPTLQQLSSQQRAERNFDFKCKLLSIAAEISTDALIKLLYICDLPERVKASIKEPLELFQELLTRSVISRDDVTHLVWLLEKTGNLQLAQRVTLELGDSATPDETNYFTFPPLTNDFIGREKDVKDIVTELTRETNPVRVVVIVSLLAMGKTQLAIAVGHALLKGLESITAKKVMFVCRTEDLTELCAQIIRQISGRNPSESHDLVLIAKDKLSRVRSDIIIILDHTSGLQNKQREKFDDFVEYVMEKAANVQLIITTREDLGCKSLNIYKKQLEPVDCHSCALLIRRSVFISEENAQKIGNLCGGMPLFLVHCVALLKSSFKPERLIQFLRSNPVPLLKKNEKRVYETLGSFLGNIPKPLLENIVQVSVFPSAFSVEDISQILFEDDELESAIIVTRMVGFLRRVGNDKYALHPLVRQYCRTERNVLEMEDVGKSAQGRFNKHCIEKLETLSKDFITKDKATSAISSFKACKENLMDALWNCLEKKSSADEKILAVDVTNSTEVLDFLAQVLSPAAKCLEFYEKCHDIARDSGDQRRLADSLSALGFLHLCNVAQLTPNQQSLDKFKEAKRIRETLPEEQQNCQAHALTLCKLGLCYALQDEQPEGLKLIERSLAFLFI